MLKQSPIKNVLQGQILLDRARALNSKKVDQQKCVKLILNCLKKMFPIQCYKKYSLYVWVWSTGNMTQGCSQVADGIKHLYIGRNDVRIHLHIHLFILCSWIYWCVCRRLTWKFIRLAADLLNLNSLLKESF